jgi:hypothetical protein
MADLITNKDTRALNGYPPNGSDMGKVLKGTRITSTGTSSDGKYTGYKLPDGKFRCIPTADLSPVGVTPPPVDPPPVVDPPTQIQRPPDEIMARWLQDGVFTEWQYYDIRQ